MAVEIEMYAVLDIETTGGKYNEEGITEIAIYRFDGQKIIDQFSSLINPEREIQPFVQRLTGINAKMLVNAPKFYEIAKRVIEITEDCILVAHNAEFDCRILETEFRRLSYSFKRKSLCTVAISQELLPDQESYSLGKLVRSLGIPISDQHRAFGDALATLKLFSLLVEKDSKKNIIKQQLKDSPFSRISPKYLRLLEELPTATGIYYLYNKNQKIIYIGKSKNIRKQVQNHLTQTSKKNLILQRQLHQISYTPLGNELIALLKEQHEIKIHKPPFNRSFKHFLFPVVIQVSQEDNYYTFKLNQITKKGNYFARFPNKKAALHQIEKWKNTFNLCNNPNQIDQEEECKRFTSNQCYGACKGLEHPEKYNKRLMEIISDWEYPHSNFLLIDKGREVGEYSFLYFTDSMFRGYGYYELNSQLKSKERIENRLITIQETQDIKHIICNFIGRKKFLKIIPFQAT